MSNQRTSLIAEVDLDVATEIKFYLTSLDYKVYPILSKVEELLSAAMSFQPSLIITDVNLCGQLDGIEAIARLEKDFNFSYIFITAYDDYSRLITSYYLNPVSLITAPIHRDNLVRSISKVKFY